MGFFQRAIILAGSRGEILLKRSVLEKILTSTPVNKSSAIVSGQKGTCNEPLSRDELNQLKERLVLKQKQLKCELGITNHRQHKNLMARFNKYGCRVNGHKAPDKLQLYVQNGKAIQLLQDKLNELKKSVKS